MLKEKISYLPWSLNCRLMTNDTVDDCLATQSSTWDFISSNPWLLARLRDGHDDGYDAAGWRSNDNRRDYYLVLREERHDKRHVPREKCKSMSTAAIANRPISYEERTQTKTRCSEEYVVSSHVEYQINEIHFDHHCTFSCSLLVLSTSHQALAIHTFRELYGVPYLHLYHLFKVPSTLCGWDRPSRWMDRLMVLVLVKVRSLS